MVSPEVAPFAKTGGLADVAGALPQALHELGCQVTVVMPCYTRLMPGSTRAQPVVDNLAVPPGSGETTAAIYRGRLADSVEIYFVRGDEFFDRDHLYATPEGDYGDNARRFSWFCRAALALCPVVGVQPDVVHCHDWQSALIPAYLKLLLAADPFWARTATMVTIHNIAFQGQFAAEVFPMTGLPEQFFSIEGMEFWGGVNFLKAGIVSADLLTTVSPRYGQEIQTAPHGNGLEGVIQAQRHKLHGILNGADYREWSPETDPYIAANYSREQLQGKRRCKLDLLHTVGLPERLRDRPLLGMVSRLTDQKGLDLLVAILEELVARELGLVVLGTGEERYHRLLAEAGARHRDRVAIRLLFDECLAHKIEAGADMFLMPSRFEPCGLNQIYSLRYGTVPIVRATGGLHDTVSEFDPARGEGVGFRFTEYEPDAFRQAIDRALRLFADEKTWRQIMRNGMAMDFSWKAAARRYLALYERAVEERRRSGQGRRGVGGRVLRG
jgi:starch synthase